MALTTAQYVRVRIQDLPAAVDATYYGDGQATSFALPHRNITSGSAFVAPGGGAWSATGATFNTSGAVAFATAISANSGFRVTYVQSVFSDDEVDEFVTRGGSVAGAALEAVGALMFDGLKRASWSSSDGTQYDDTQAQRMLIDLHDRLEADVMDESIQSGGLFSWSDS